MANQIEINRLHEALNDILVDLHQINVCDEESRESKQSAILSIIAMRKMMDNLGLRHGLIQKPANA